MSPMSQPAPRPQPRPELLEIEAYVPGKPAPAGAGKTYKLSSNESPLGPSPKAIAAYREAAANLASYPDGGASALRHAIGARHGVDPARLLCGNGSDELIGLIAQVLLTPGDEGLYSQFGFVSYPIAIRAAGGTPVIAPERDWTADVDALLAHVSERTRVVFFANPNNPTGSLLPRGELARLHAGLPADTLLVLDSAYAEYVAEDSYEPGVELVDAHENVVMLRTFSKAYGLAGLRVGFAVAHENVADAIRITNVPFSVSAIAQAAAVASLQPTAEKELLERVDATVRERARVLAALRATGWKVPDTEANFVWLPAGSATDALAGACEAAGVVVRPFSGEGVRVTIGEPEANDLFLKVADDAAFGR